MYSTSATTSKVIRGIGVTLAVLAGIGLVVSSMPLAMFAPRTTPPPQIQKSDFPADFTFEIASTTDARVQGLSGRALVPANYGLLFVFESPAIHEFWMKDMLVPIDIIWIAEDGRIIGIEPEVSPDSYPKLFSPATPVRYVLETKAGESDRLGLETGDIIPLPVL